MVVVLLIVATVYFLYFYCTRTFNHWTQKHVKGPKPVPFFGNLLESTLRRKHIGIVFKEIYDAFPKEKVVGMYRMTAPTLIIRDLDLVKLILIKDFEAFPERGIVFSKERLGNNLFHCDSDTWRVLRKKLSPVFTSGKVKFLVDVFSEQGDRFIDYLEKVTLKRSEQEVHQHLQKYTMSTILSASFGLNVDLFNENRGIVEQAGYYAFKSTYAAEIEMFFPNILKNLNMSLYNDIVNKFSNDVVKTAIQLRNGVPSERNDAIDLLLTLKKEGKIDAFKRRGNEKDVSIEITENVMAGQAFIIFLAGFGNNALTISYSLFHLARHSAVQDKLFKEITDVLKRHNGKLVYDAIKEMTYLDHVFSETLRLNPLTNAIQRVAACNYKVPGSDIVIDKGTSIIISPYAIQRDERNFDNANEFRPERFSQENFKDWHSCAFIPFGVGPRSCIGRQLAKLQYTTALVKVLLKFKVEASPLSTRIEDYDPMRTLISTKGGIYVELTPRN